MKCGLLGKKLGHSYSPQIHSFLGEYTYELFEREPEDLDSFFRSADFDSINVTIPYKKDVIKYCDELSDVAKTVGAVNTIVKRDGKLIGHNTDYYGFLSMINETGLVLKAKKVLVLGSGGASVTAQAVLKKLGAHVVVISRTGKDNYSNLSIHHDASCIVNCTPVGMYPNNGYTLLSLSSFTNLQGVFDMIYNPAKTKLLLEAEKMGIVAANGLWMLVAQAKESAEWFLNKEITGTIIPFIHDQLQKQMKNIILIGMPGCGKTTISKLLGKMLSRPVMDSDEYIEQSAGISIPEIFATQGEKAFRQLETKVLSDLCKRSGSVIATGGGCVTTPENYELLRQNSIVIWVKRSLELLSTEGRPLSANHNLQEMYRIREPLYLRFAHFEVENAGDIIWAAEQIANVVK